MNTWKLVEEGKCHFDRHSENFCDIFSLELNLESILVVSGSSTRFTFDIDVREKVHLDLLGSTSFTDLTATTASIERESPRSESTFLCIESSCENLSYIGKYSGVCGDVGMWSFSNRGLIDDDNLVDVRHSFDTFMSTNGMCRPIEVIDEFCSEDIHDK